MHPLRAGSLAILLLSLFLAPFPPAPPVAHAAQTNACISKWTPVPMPLPASGDPVLRRVSSSASDDVWAVGFLRADENVPSQTLIEHWDGAEWTLVPVPNVEGYANELNDVAVLTKSDAWAVGSGTADYISHILMLHWDGSVWTIVHPLNGQADTGALVSVSGVATDDVWAVGTRQGNALILHWDGTEWQSVPSPINLSFTRVIAQAADDVWALGVDADHNATILHWDGSTWAVSTSFQLAHDEPQAPNPNAQWEGVSDFVVPAANDIWVVGYVSSKYNQSGSRWHWDGTSWSSSGAVVGTGGGGGAIQTIAGLRADNLWVFAEHHIVIQTRTLSHRNSSGWFAFDMNAMIPQLDSASITAVSDKEFWIVGTSYFGLESFAGHGIFTCDAPPDERATLVSPVPGEIVTQMYTAFEWQAIDSSSHYNLEVTRPYGGDPVVIEQLLNSEFVWDRHPIQNGEHTWRVQACNYVGCGPWSDPVTWTQRMRAPGAPQLLSPPSGTSFASDNVTVEWTEVSDALWYNVELYKDAPVGPAYATARIYNGIHSWYRNGLGEGQYYWRAQACNPGGCSAWADMFKFTIFYPPPPRPVLRVPAAKAVIKTRKPLFEWDNWEDARITLELRIKSKNGALVDTLKVGSQGSFRWPRILPNGQYYWRVKGCNDYGCSKWSKGRKFTIQK